MKKAVLILAALLLVSSFVFAQDASVKVGAWGRGIFVPLNSNMKTLTGVSWGNNTRVGMTISGTSPNVGFQADFNVDKGGPGLGDNQKIWIKPMDMVTLQIGVFMDETLRLGAGAWGGADFASYAGKIGDDAVFSRVASKNIEVSVKPMDGLYIYGALGGIMGTADVQAYDAFISGQYGAGYTIAGIGVVSAQFLGTDRDSGKINAAFKLTAVEKLTVAVGGYFPIALSNAGKPGKAEMADVALDASYAIDALTLKAMGYVYLPDTSVDTNGKMKLEVGLGASYGLGDGLGIDADVRYQDKEKSGQEGGVIGATIALQKGFSNGKLGVALQLSNGQTGKNFSGIGTVGKNEADPIVWTLPVKFEYWF